MPTADRVDPAKFREAKLAAWRERPLKERREALAKVLDTITLEPGGVTVRYDAAEYCGAQRISSLDSSLCAADIENLDVPPDILEQMGSGAIPQVPEVPLDVDIRLGDEVDGPPARLVNIQTADRWRAYLTNVPRSTHDAAAISFLHALRWSVELHFKLAKRDDELDQTYTGKPVSAKTLVHAAMLASLPASALAHAEHVDQGYVGDKVVRPPAKRPPVHAMTIWKMVRTSARSIIPLLAGDPNPPNDWARVARLMQWPGKAPHWRSKPSPTDDAKGRNAAGRAMWRHTATKRPLARKSRATK